MSNANAVNSGPSGLWDMIFGVNDDTIIDLSALGEIEWAGSSTSSTSNVGDYDSRR